METVPQLQDFQRDKISKSSSSESKNLSSRSTSEESRRNKTTPHQMPCAGYPGCGDGETRACVCTTHHALYLARSPSLQQEARGHQDCPAEASASWAVGLSRPGASTGEGRAGKRIPQARLKREHAPWRNTEGRGRG